MSIEQHIPRSKSSDDWINSLERAVEICRDQISFARAMSVGSIAVPVDSLEKILDANARTPSDAAVRDVESLAKEIAANFVVDINDLSQTTEFIAAIITKHLAARTGEESSITKEGVNE